MQDIKTKATAALIAAAMLLTGCGNNDKPNENDDGAGTSKTSGNFTPASNVRIWDVLPEMSVTDTSSFTYKYDSKLGGMVVTDYLNESPKVRIPDTLEGEPVVKIDFSGLKKELTQLIMPDSVVDFSLSSKIKSALQYANIPKGMSEIEKNTFSGCTSLIGAHIPNSVSVICSDAFAFCKSLESISIPNSVTEIGIGAFRECTNLTNVTIPNSTTVIGDDAFSGCTSLKSINIPDNVTKISGDAFSGCKSLISITYKGKTYDYEHIADLYGAINLGESGVLIEGGVLKDVSPKLTEVTIPDGVTIIENAFRDCTSLTSVTLPDSVHTIDKSAFSACQKVKVKYRGKSYDYEQLDDLYNKINYGESGVIPEKLIYSTKNGYIPPFEVSCKGVYMVNLDTDTVVVSQNSDEKLYPNSAAMIMTCLVAFENVKDLNSKVTCPYDCFDEFHTDNPNFTNPSNAGIAPKQDNLTYWDCLNAMMISSACDAANIIAYNVGGGSIDTFVDMMNETAQRIGCENTHFSNPHGLFDENNYTTAYVLYLITKYAIENFPEILKICGTYEYDMPSNSYSPSGYSIKNTNQMIDPNSPYYCEGVQCIKAGSNNEYYLKKDGSYDFNNPVSGTRTLVTAAEKDRFRYLIVTLGTPFTKDQTHYSDHSNLYNWVFDNFENKQISWKGRLVMAADIVDGVSDTIDIATDDNCFVLIPKGTEVTAVNPNISPILAPVRAGKYVGSLELRLNDETIAVVPLVTAGDVLRKETNSTSN